MRSLETLAGYRMVLLALILCLSSSALAQDKIRVLLIWDSQNAQTEALKKALETNGLEVVLSETNETGFNGQNPPLGGFHVVIHLNGTTFNSEMTLAGQKALVSFVVKGGGYIHHEWNAYQLGRQQMTTMRDLILFDRRSGYSGKIVIQRLDLGKMHPVVWEVPKQFEMEGGCNIGKAHVFQQNPVTVLARDTRGNDAIAAREFGLGRIVGFHHGGNWSYTQSALFDKREARRLFADSVRWAHGCGPAFAKGARKATCKKIAQRLPAEKLPAELQTPPKP